MNAGRGASGSKAVGNGQELFPLQRECPFRCDGKDYSTAKVTQWRCCKIGKKCWVLLMWAMAAEPCIFPYRVRNWPTYNQGMVTRGGITFCGDESALVGWKHSQSVRKLSDPSIYLNALILFALVVKSVYGLNWRAAQEVLSSLLSLMTLDLPVPNCSFPQKLLQFSRRKTGYRGETISFFLIDLSFTDPEGELIFSQG